MAEESLPHVTIEKLYIERFGCLRRFSLTLVDGVNIIEGANESGKSTLAGFLSFIFYGFRDKADREFHMPWLVTEVKRDASGHELTSEEDGARSSASDSAAGSVTLSVGGVRLRVERECTPSGTDRTQTVSLDNNSVVSRSKTPGAELLGVPADVFVRTAFIGQPTAVGSASEDGPAVSGSTLGAAIENLLFSADESVNVQRAVKKLDRERVELLHKNGGGGRIAELETRRADLSRRLTEASRNNARIIAAESSLAEQKEKLEEKNAETAELSRRRELYEAALRLRRLDDVEAMRGRAAELESDCESFARAKDHNGFTPDAAYRAELARASSELEWCDRTLAGIRGELSSGGEPPEPSPTLKKLGENGGKPGVLAELARLDRRRGTSAVFGVLFAILAGLISAVGALLLIDGRSTGGIVLLCGIAFLIVCACFFSASIGARRRADDLVCSYDAETPDELNEKLDDLLAEADELNRRRGSAAALGERLRAAEAARAAKTKEIEAVLARWGRSSLAAALSELDEFFAALAAKRREAEKARAAYSEVSARLGGTDGAELKAKLEAAGVDPAAITDDDLREVRRRYDFAVTTSKALGERCHELDCELTAVKASSESPAALADSLTETERELKDLGVRHRALLLACEKLEAAGNGLRAGVSPRLSKYAGELMKRVTGGRYNQLGVDGNMELTFESAGLTRPGTAMSSGTRDAAYISLRFALINLLYRKASPPVIFDEAFARLDDSRLSGILSIMHDYSASGAQVVILTCHSREAVIMRDIGRFGHHML